MALVETWWGSQKLESQYDPDNGLLVWRQCTDKWQLGGNAGSSTGKFKWLLFDQAAHQPAARLHYPATNDARFTRAPPASPKSLSCLNLLHLWMKNRDWSLKYLQGVQLPSVLCPWQYNELCVAEKYWQTQFPFEMASFFWLMDFF